MSGLLFSDPSPPSPVVTNLKHAGPCPGENWHRHNGYCYLFYPLRLSFGDARENCKHFGADLVSMMSAEEHRFVNDTAINVFGELEHVHTGLTDQNKDGNFKWISGATADPLYSAKRYEARSGEYCYELVTGEGNWESISCRSRFHRKSVCKIGKRVFFLLTTSSGCIPPPPPPDLTFWPFFNFLASW